MWELCGKDVLDWEVYSAKVTSIENSNWLQESAVQISGVKAQKTAGREAYRP